MKGPQNKRLRVQMATGSRISTIRGSTQDEKSIRKSWIHWIRRSEDLRTRVPKHQGVIDQEV
jgi:hypothetical protein